MDEGRNPAGARRSVQACVQGPHGVPEQDHVLEAEDIDDGAQVPQIVVASVGGRHGPVAFTVSALIHSQDPEGLRQRRGKQVPGMGVVPGAVEKEKGPSGVRAPFQDAEPQARDLKEMLGSRRGVDRRRVPFARQDFRDRDVGSGEIVRLQAGRPHPEDLLVVTEQEIARAVGYPVSPEVNFRMGIGVTATSHEGTHGDIDPELLLHLPSQASLGGLAGFYFSSGELPLALHAVSPPAASDQNPAVLFQNGGRNGYLLQGGSFGAHSA